MSAPSPASELGFSQVREDPGVELALVARLHEALGRPLRVLMVASGGCSALALLADPRVASVALVDPNPAQLHLVTLRAEAALALAPAEQAALLGFDPRQAPERTLAAYAALRLPEATRAYWDARPEQVAYGLNRVGRFEQIFRELAAACASAGLDPVARPAEALVAPGWQAAFEEAFGFDRLVQAFGPEAVRYSMEQSFAEHFRQAFERVMREGDPALNPFFYQVFRDAYPPGGWPLYLQAGPQAALKARGLGDLSYHPGTLQAVAADLPRTHYDLIQCSNVGDWMPLETFRALLALLTRALGPGGALLGRRLNGDYDLAAELDRTLASDRAFADRLWRGDRSFFYSQVVPGFRVG